jgi:hypothetical protein
LNERPAPTPAPSARSLPLAVRAWLLGDPATPPRARRGLDALTFGLFVALVCAGAAGHETWRDEMRALSLALEPDSWLGLPATLRDEGHPALWHLLLRIAHGVIGSSAVLPIVTAVVGIAGAALLYFGSPLPTWWRAGFLFGWVPLFSASILRRNYGITMLLLFAFCWLVTRAKPRPLLAAASLALLANTNVYGTMMAGCFALVLAVDCWRRQAGAARLAAALGLVAAGVAVAAWTMLPSPQSRLLPAPVEAVTGLAGAVLDGIARFPHTCGPVFGHGAVAWPFVLLTVAATLVTPHVALAVLAFFAGAAWFIGRVYTALPHHLGMLFLVLVAATWLRAAAAGAARSAPRSPLQRFAWPLLLFVAWPPLLALHAYRGLRAVKSEVESLNTCAPELAALLDRPDLRDAVLIGEPDYFLDALPAYRDNPIWVWRENRFARRVSWTTANRSAGDLDGLVAAARAVQRDSARPVLLVIGKQIPLEQPLADVVHGYGTRFSWTAAQHRAFAAATELVARLPADASGFRGDEHYDVYRLRAP